MKNRAYSLLEIKSVDDETRVITGIATTPASDREEDIILPEGARYKLPIPFLWQHKHEKPIGFITRARVTKKGIEIVAEIARGVTKDIEEYWQMIKSGLVRGLSIGLIPKETENIRNSLGRIIKTWEWIELSAVTVPANAEATILTVKKYDAEVMAASGKSAIENQPGVSGNKQQTVVELTPERKTPMAQKSIGDQIAEFEETRKVKSLEISTIMNGASDRGETLDAEETEKYDALSADVKAIDAHIDRLRDMEKLDMKSARPVGDGKSAESAMAARSRPIVQVKGDNLPKGVEFARYVKSLATAKGDPLRALAIAESNYPDQTRIHTVLKAAVSAGTTSDPTWAKPLVDYQNFAGDFIEYLRPSTIIGKFGTGDIPSLRRVPFQVQIPKQTSGGAAYWVGEGKSKPLTKFDFGTFTLGFSKVANIAVLTKELMRFSDPAVDLLVRDALKEAIVERMDRDFVNPEKAIGEASPGSITNGATTIVSSGDPEVDIDAAYTKFIKANLSTSGAVWIMSEILAQQLSRRKNVLGQREYPDMGPRGGTFDGLPTITSQYVPDGVMILASGSEIYLADDDQILIDASTEASLEMSDSPTGDSGAPTSTQMVSLWQTNSVGILAERFINWKRRRDEAVVYITGADYAPKKENGGGGSGG